MVIMIKRVLALVLTVVLLTSLGGTVALAGAGATDQGSDSSTLRTNAPGFRHRSASMGALVRVYPVEFSWGHSSWAKLMDKNRPRGDLSVEEKQEVAKRTESDFALNKSVRFAYEKNAVYVQTSKRSDAHMPDANDRIYLVSSGEYVAINPNNIFKGGESNPFANFMSVVQQNETLTISGAGGASVSYEALDKAVDRWNEAFLIPLTKTKKEDKYEERFLEGYLAAANCDATVAASLKAALEDGKLGFVIEPLAAYSIRTQWANTESGKVESISPVPAWKKTGTASNDSVKGENITKHNSFHYLSATGFAQLGQEKGFLTVADPLSESSYTYAYTSPAGSHNSSQKGSIPWAITHIFDTQAGNGKGIRGVFPVAHRAYYRDDNENLTYEFLRDTESSPMPWGDKQQVNSGWGYYDLTLFMNVDDSDGEFSTIIVVDGNETELDGDDRVRTDLDLDDLLKEARYIKPANPTPEEEKKAGAVSDGAGEVEKLDPYVVIEVEVDGEKTTYEDPAGNEYPKDKLKKEDIKKWKIRVKFMYKKNPPEEIEPENAVFDEWLLNKTWKSLTEISKMTPVVVNVEGAAEASHMNHLGANPSETARYDASEPIVAEYKTTEAGVWEKIKYFLNGKVEGDKNPRIKIGAAGDMFTISAFSGLYEYMKAINTEPEHPDLGFNVSRNNVMQNLKDYTLPSWMLGPSAKPKEVVFQLGTKPDVAASVGYKVEGAGSITKDKKDTTNLESDEIDGSHDKLAGCDSWRDTADSTTVFDDVKAETDITYERYNTKKTAPPYSLGGAAGSVLTSDLSSDVTKWITSQAINKLSIYPTVDMYWRTGDTFSESETAIPVVGEQKREIKPVSFHRLSVKNDNVKIKTSSSAVATDSRANALSQRMSGGVKAPVYLSSGSLNIGVNFGDAFEAITYSLDFARDFNNTAGSTAYSQLETDWASTYKAKESHDKYISNLKIAVGDIVANVRVSGAGQAWTIKPQKQSELRFTSTGQTMEVAYLTCKAGVVTDWGTFDSLFSSGGGDTSADMKTKLRIADLVKQAFEANQGKIRKASGKPWYNEDTTVLCVRKFTEKLTLSPIAFTDKIHAVFSPKSATVKNDQFNNGYLAKVTLDLSLSADNGSWSPYASGSSAKLSNSNMSITPTTPAIDFIIPNVSVMDVR